MTQPTTLPADFGEWDSGEEPAAPHPPPSGFNAYPSPAVAPKPIAKPVTARVAVQPVAARSPNIAPRRPAPVFEEAEQVFQQQPQSRGLNLTGQSYEDEEEPKKKGMFVVVGSVAAVLVIGAGVLLYPHMTHPKATTTVVQTAVPQVAAPTELTPSKPMAATASIPTAATVPTPADADKAAHAQSEMINHQLAAPSRISKDLTALTGKEAPPPSSGFNPSGTDLGSNTSMFNSSQGEPKVKIAAPQKVNISAGIAVGLLVQRTAPVYPPIAKTARVSGTVVIQATISKTGTVENLHVVNGPTMLRQAALDAVKTWRYKPYLLSGEPVEVETTVNVIFALGG
ncbi:MAG: energy transducer TonB [Terracidiphilus sp.]